MQWGHIKTLFILSFLVLNIYLISALVDRQQDVGYLDNRELPIEDQLASAEIKYDSIQVDETQLAYISAGQKELDDEEISEFANSVNQTIEIFHENLIVSTMHRPIGIPQTMGIKELESIVKSNVLYGEEYSLWDWNEELNVIIFFQVKEDRMIYYNENGLLLLFLNENNEVTHYVQTILGEAVVQGDLVQLNQPPQVIGQLFNANYLNRGDEVTDVKIGYYSRIAAEGIQVFAPTWKVTVNNERNHFVNAIEGIIYENDQNDFLFHVISDYVTRIKISDDDNNLEESILPTLEERLDKLSE